MERSFQDRIAEAARLAGGAQSLADKAGLSRRVVGKYLAGKSDPSRERLVRIADAAGVSIEWLASGRGPMVRGAIGAANEATTPVENIPLERSITWLREWWARASPDERAWMRIQFERTFPEFSAWQKKQEPSSKRQSGA